MKRKKHPKAVLATWLGSVVLATSVVAQEGTEKVDFASQILPIIEQKCLSCHQSEHEVRGRKKRPKGKLALDNVEAIMKGGGSYPEANVIPGKPDESWFLKTLLLPDDDDMFMPPKGDPTTAEEQALIRRWIEQGADFGTWKALAE